MAATPGCGAGQMKAHADERAMCGGIPRACILASCLNNQAVLVLRAQPGARSFARRRRARRAASADQAPRQLRVAPAGARVIPHNANIVYVSKDQAETSALFELIGNRYERRSMLITANQPLGEWGEAPVGRLPGAAACSSFIFVPLRHLGLIRMT
jgi:IstB-like ATP binding protein